MTPPQYAATYRVKTTPHHSYRIPKTSITLDLDEHDRLVAIHTDTLDNPPPRAVFQHLPLPYATRTEAAICWARLLHKHGQQSTPTRKKLHRTRGNPIIQPNPPVTGSPHPARRAAKPPKPTI